MSPMVEWAIEVALNIINHMEARPLMYGALFLALFLASLVWLSAVLARYIINGSEE